MLVSVDPGGAGAVNDEADGEDGIPELSRLELGSAPLWLLVILLLLLLLIILIYPRVSCPTRE